MHDYLELTKPRITWLILMSTAVGYVFGLPAHGWLDCLHQIANWRTLHTLLGTGLMASGTAALNEWHERDADARMRRTAGRPIPSGKITPAAALIFGALISLIGFLELAFGANWQAAGWGAATLVSYLGVYTPLKKRSPVCTTVGAIPGAVPPAIGYAAARGALTVEGLALAAILFLWQFPHFYAIAWMYR
jgi:protoheme IX farnesyltransferase